MYSIQILKAGLNHVLPMNQEFDTKRTLRESLKEEESSDLGEKVSSYALVNRPSPPF